MCMKWKYLFLTGVCVMLIFALGQYTANYKGKTAKEWATVSDQKDKMIASMTADLKFKDNIISGYSIEFNKHKQTINIHAGMKEIKGMDCKSQNNDKTTDCQEYDYWYYPNVTPQPLPSNMLQ